MVDELHNQTHGVQETANVLGRKDAAKKPKFVGIFDEIQ
jgi:hypothetical protein